MRTPDQILALWNERRGQRATVIEQMRTVAAHYNGEVAVPLPEIDKREAPMVANFLAQGIDGHGMRIASVMPSVNFAPDDPAKKSSVIKARTRRRAVYGWWQANEMRLRMRKRARWLAAYANAPVLIVPDKTYRCPVWELRSPLDTYPAETPNDGMLPADCIFAYTRTGGWLARNYGHVLTAVNNARGKNEAKIGDTDFVDILEYVDHEQRTLLATGAGHALDFAQAEWGAGDARILNLAGLGNRGQWIATLETEPNLAGVCNVVNPGRISLGSAKGQFDDSIGVYGMLAKLMALDVNAVTRAVFPDTWFIHNDQGTGEIITVADGLTGTVGEVRGGQLKDMPINPGYQTMPTIDRLERALRLNNAMPAEMGGESGSNIRTDRRGQSILSAAIDFHIQEHQDILGISSEHEIEIAAKVEAAYFGKSKKSFYLTWQKERGRPDQAPKVEYVPADLWSGEVVPIVEYANAGMDANAQMVVLGQQVGTGMLSKRTAMIQAPNVPDPEAEHGQILVEGLEAAQMSGLQQQAAAGALPPVDLARIQQLVRDGDVDLADAVIRVHEEAQKRQASSGPVGTPEGPVEPGAPEAQPGLGQPGQGAEQPAAIEPPAASLSNLRSILGNIGRSQALAARGA